MSQRSLFGLVMLLTTMTQALPSITSAFSLETRASKTCPRGQRVQLSITRGERRTLYGITSGDPTVGLGGYVDFTERDVTQAVR